MDKNKQYIVITAGGTGGHIFPANSLRKGLSDLKKYRVRFITDTRGSSFIDGTSSRDSTLVIPTIRPSVIRIFSLPLEFNKFLFSVAKILFMFLRDRPSLIVGFGGYASLPTLIAGFLSGIPVIIHESNAVMGRTNRWFLPFAKAAMVNFQSVIGVDKAYINKLKLTGTPVRECISKFSSKKRINSDEFNILVIGGSQGSKIVSEAVPKAIVSLPQEMRSKIAVWQQVRPGQEELASSLYKGMVKDFTVSTFFSDKANDAMNIGELMFNADLVIARAGASTISEIETLGKSSVLIPFAAAKDDHQLHNANMLAKKDAAIIINESDDMVDQLTDVLSGLINNPKAITEMARKAKSNLHLKSIPSIISIVRLMQRSK